MAGLLAGHDSIVGRVGSRLQGRFLRRGREHKPDFLHRWAPSLDARAIPAAARHGAVGPQRHSGIAWAFVTGILGGAGNIAFFRALQSGGKVSIVAPATALFPIVTVILAVTFLRERISKQQIIGFALALVAIYLLSM